jgi:DNA invertase Pin-like site-specific DNA recombinase
VSEIAPHVADEPGRRWAVYVRQNAWADPSGAERQAEFIGRVEAALNLRIPDEDVFADIAGGRDAERPGLAALRAGVRSGGYGALLVADVARLSRDTAELGELVAELRRLDVDLVTADRIFVWSPSR